MTTLTEREEVHTVPNTAAEILAAARALAPQLRARSAEIEENRRLPADIVELLRAAGVWRMGFTEQDGGPGLSSTEQTEVIEALSYGDTSVGWCAMVGMDTGLFANYLPAEAVPRMFPSLDVVTAGMLFAAGRADRVPGGYRVSGRWSFGSGLTHADWITAGTHTFTDGVKDLTPTGRPNWQIMMVRPEQIERIDNWRTTGLCATSSQDYRIDDLFVPEEHTFTFRMPRCTEGPLSTPDLQMRKMPGVAIGAARAALDFVRDIARTKVNKVTGQPWSDSYRVQTTIGECEQDYLVMRHAVYGSLNERWDRLAEGASLAEFSVQERISTMLTRASAFRTARSIVRRLYDLLATTSIYKPSPMDRWLRDLETACQHFMAQDQIIQSAGAFAVGGKPQLPLALGILD